MFSTTFRLVAFVVAAAGFNRCTLAEDYQYTHDATMATPDVVDLFSL